MMAGARAATAVKMGAGAMATFAVVGLGLAFFPSVKLSHVGLKSAVEQPVFVLSGPVKTPPSSVPTSVAAKPVASPPAERTNLDQLATALKAQPAKPAPTSSAPPVATANSEARDSFAHGLASLARGDISAARRWLEHAADLGEQRAFVALGDSYNPSTLIRLGVLGLRGDSGQARDYYSRAVAAGLSGARDRLASLEPGAR